MKLDYSKYADGLVPVIVQDSETGSVLMLGFMNEEALNKTRDTGLVTFYSRSRIQLWTKGETSGNYLHVDSMTADCDEDTLLIKARPAGPVCHSGTSTCFGKSVAFWGTLADRLAELETVIDARRSDRPKGSYVAGLFEKGLNKIAQKVGEEAVELVIEAKDDDLEKFRSEAADLLFHYLILLRAKDVSMKDVIEVLESRKEG